MLPLSTPSQGLPTSATTTTAGVDNGKDTGFTNCCQSEDVFQTERDLTDCCTYSQLDCPIETLKKLSGQQQSDWVKCFGDSQDDTECCEQAGLG